VLAENAGLDAIDLLVDLRAAHEAGDTEAGLNVFSGEVENTTEAGVVETAHAKEQAIASAAEAANLVLKIDDIISAGDLSTGGDGDEGGAPPAAWAAWAVWAVRCNHSVGYLHSRRLVPTAHRNRTRTLAFSGFVFGAVEARSSRVSLFQQRSVQEQRRSLIKNEAVASPVRGCESATRSNAEGGRRGWGGVRCGAVLCGGWGSSTGGSKGQPARTAQATATDRRERAERVTEDRSERAPSSWLPAAGALETFTVDPLEATYKRATGTLEKSTAGCRSRQPQRSSLAHHSRGSLRRHRRRHYATDTRREVGRNRSGLTCPAGRCR